jgi:hypothetical protein
LDDRLELAVDDVVLVDVRDVEELTESTMAKNSADALGRHRRVRLVPSAGFYGAAKGFGR